MKYINFLVLLFLFEICLCDSIEYYEDYKSLFYTPPLKFLKTIEVIEIKYNKVFYKQNEKLKSMDCGLVNKIEINENNKNYTSKCEGFRTRNDIINFTFQKINIKPNLNPIQTSKYQQITKEEKQRSFSLLIGLGGLIGLYANNLECDDLECFESRRRLYDYSFALIGIGGIGLGITF